ncbi:concanavalin A-like lectin/glucanase domain-containing protein [Dendryphion nanum]|uniref:Concanavalin A-like lectin/glucanase domain-containing protein n=1 Tax=Dendryphion nanum TaxID=256645 RepID=A0A9P9E3R7_9PLEO|nr:concanavalin A-like lectin/glucanase domain-containing protein [Dendryphion nanum]
MSGTLNKLFEKGKAKAKAFTDSHSSSHQGQAYGGQSQGNPNQQYPGSGYSPQPSSYYGAPPNQYSQPPQHPQYGGGPPQNQQWGPPPNQWGPPPTQWGAPSPQQPFSPPPIPQHSKPQSPIPPPLPGNRPVSQQQVNLASSAVPSSPMTQNDLKVYWQASFDKSIPVSENFRHELGDHGWGNNEKQNYVDAEANSFHHDGRLIVRALVNHEANTFTSARLSSWQSLSRPRGYLTATILAPSAAGIWPAYWMLPKDPFSWPGDGEVDIFESWNGELENHSCLHWGSYTGEDWDKHRVIKTNLQDLHLQPHTFGFAWIEEEGIPDWRGRLIWYIDGRPVMKGNIPLNTRRMEDFRILINIAMGGTVNKGKLPSNGYYDLVVSDLKMCEEPIGGWSAFESAWANTPEGKPS